MSFKTVLIFCLITGLKSDPTSKLTPCRKDDTVCYNKNANIMYEATISGEPDWNIKGLDPATVKYIEGNMGSVTYYLRDSTAKGFKNCYVQSTELSYEKSEINFAMHCPYLVLRGLYETNGRLFGLPIQGDGLYVIEGMNHDLYLHSEVQFTNREDGRRYVTFKRFNAKSVPKGLKFNATNLFNGNEVLAKPMLRVINQYGKEFAAELQEPVLNAFVKKIVKNMNALMKHISFDSVIIP